MGVFDTIKETFSSSGLADHWNVLDDISQIEAVIAASERCPQLVYKHSSRCSVCLFARGQIEEVAESVIQQVDLHFVDVIGQRTVSNAIAEELSVRHESPQLLIVSGGQVVWHTSHGAIRSHTITDKLEKCL